MADVLRKVSGTDEPKHVLPYPVRLFFVISASLSGIGLAVEAIACFVLHLGWPYKSPLLDEKPLPDFRFAQPIFALVHSAKFFSLPYPAQFMYPAALAPIFGFFYLFHHPGTVYGVTLILVSLGLAALFAITLSKRTTLTKLHSSLVAFGTLALSYPLAFELKQGNVEFYVAITVGIGIWLFLTEKYHAAAVLLGSATAMKLFPFVYFGLFLYRRRYAPLVTGLSAASLITIGSLWYICPDVPVAWHGTQKNLAVYQATTPLELRREAGYDHSAFAATKIFIKTINGKRQVDYAPLLKRYLIIMAVLGLAAYVAKIRQLPIINQIIALCVASILMPPVSYDYTLLHLYIPFVLLVFFAFKTAKSDCNKGLSIVFACLAVLTSVQTEVIFHTRSYGGQIKMVALCVLFAAALLYEYPDAASEASMPIEDGPDSVVAKQPNFS